MHASFGNINSIKIGTQISTKNSEKEEKFNLLSHKQCLSMIIENLKIYLQNVQKNKLLIKNLLETQKKFDILFIQEPP